MDSKQIGEQSYRWVVLGLYCSSVVANALIWISVSPITSSVAQVYGVSKIWVEMCSLVYMVLYIPMVFPSNYILDNLGLKTGVFIGTAFTVLGSLARLGAYYEFWYILLGSTLAGLGQPFLLSAPAKVAAFWFRPEMRTFATTMGAVANPLGIALGFVLPAAVNGVSTKSDVGLLMLIQASVVVPIGVLVFVLFKNKPKVPPSYTAGQEREKFLKSIKDCFRCRSFNALLVAFSMGQGSLNALATLLEQISSPYGFNEDDNSLFGALVIVAGLVGSGLAGLIVSWNQKYKAAVLVMMFGAVGGLLAFTLTLELGSLPVSCIFCTLLGLLLMPILPISFEFVCELTYPIGEDTTGGLLNSGGQVVGITQIGLAYLLSNSPLLISFISIVGLLVGAVALFFCKEDLKRTNCDNLLETD